MRNKKKVTLSYIACCMVLSAPLFATMSCPTIPGKSQAFSIGGTVFGYHYKEPGVMHSKGMMAGINGDYTATFPLLFMKVDADAVIGRTNYHSERTGKYDYSEPNQRYETRITLGKSFVMGKNNTISPYIGLGIRFKHDNSEGINTTTGHWGYLRSSRYFYAPLGLTFSQPAKDRWVMSQTIEYDFFISGRQKSAMAFGDIYNRQEKGMGLRMDVMLHKAMKDGGILSFGPFLNFWRIEDSKVMPGGGRWWYEPLNRTIEAGVKVKYIF